jgi:hypothetical protein
LFRQISKRATGEKLAFLKRQIGFGWVCCAIGGFDLYGRDEATQRRSDGGCCVDGCGVEDGGGRIEHQAESKGGCKTLHLLHKAAPYVRRLRMSARKGHGHC